MARYVSAITLAERYGVNPSTIWRWSKAGVLPQPEQISNNCTRWDLDQIEERDAARKADGYRPTPQTFEASQASVRKRQAKRAGKASDAAPPGPTGPV